MAREQALNARKQRNAALVEAMLLAAMADGSVRFLSDNMSNLTFIGMCTEPGMLQALGDVSGHRPVNLADFEPNPQIAAFNPAKVAETAVPVAFVGLELPELVLFEQVAQPGAADMFGVRGKTPPGQCLWH